MAKLLNASAVGSYNKEKIIDIKNRVNEIIKKVQIMTNNARGILLCRVTDEGSYVKPGGSGYGAKMAQESILMQYGYNVSQIAGVSSMRRQMILALLVENEILTRSEIISYLNFLLASGFASLNIKLQSKNGKKIETLLLDVKSEIFKGFLLVV